MTDSSSPPYWIHELADAIQLKEGPQGIIRALWSLYSRQPESTRAWSRDLHIPVPVLAALRRELEKRDILSDQQGLQLTSKGKERLGDLFGVKPIPHSACPACEGKGFLLPPEIYPVLEQFKQYCDQRPHVDVTLDQSHATPDTGIRKALYLLEKGLINSSLLFLGDDDWISLACYLMRKHFLEESSKTGKILVLDIDPRYLKGIEEISQGEIEVGEYDVRNTFPEQWLHQFEVVLTDPAYTVNGVSTFAFRCAQALKNEGVMLLSMPIPDSASHHAIQKNLTDMGFILRDIHPQFNQYLGASVHAHTTSLFYCERFSGVSPEKSFSLRYNLFYTGEKKIPGAVYRCTFCETEVYVGAGYEFLTIQELKQAGCHECGNTKFERIRSLTTNKDESENPLE